MQDLKRDLLQLIARTKHRLEETIDGESNPRTLASILKQLADTLRQLQVAEMVEMQRKEEEKHSIEIEKRVHELEASYRAALTESTTSAGEPVGGVADNGHLAKRPQSVAPVVVGKRRGRPRSRKGG